MRRAPVVAAVLTLLVGCAGGDGKDDEKAGAGKTVKSTAGEIITAQRAREPKTPLLVPKVLPPGFTLSGPPKVVPETGAPVAAAWPYRGPGGLAANLCVAVSGDELRKCATPEDIADPLVGADGLFATLAPTAGDPAAVRQAWRHAALTSDWQHVAWITTSAKS